MDDQGNGRATIREVYELLEKVEGKIDDQLEKLALRVSRLERWRAYLAGGAAVIVLGLGILARALIH